MGERRKNACKHACHTRLPMKEGRTREQRVPNGVLLILKMVVWMRTRKIVLIIISIVWTVENRWKEKNKIACRARRKES